MIVTDLDGTLLRTDLTVSERTKEALRRCRAAGIKTAFATGRGPSASRLAPAELFDGQIVNNGSAAVADGVPYQRLIPYPMLRPFLTACDRRGLEVMSQLGEMHYANFDVSVKWPDVQPFAIVDFARHEQDTEKACLVVNTPEEEAFIEANLPDALYLVITSDRLGMIMHRDATKAKAVLELARRWGITPPEIAAFGDDLNDIDMLMAAGTGVAMGNALDAVKAAADCLCLSNDEDGLAVWLEENAL